MLTHEYACSSHRDITKRVNKTKANVFQSRILRGGTKTEDVVVVWRDFTTGDPQLPRL